MSAAPSIPALAPSSLASAFPSRDSWPPPLPAEAARASAAHLWAHADCVSIFVPILLGVLLSCIGLGMILVSAARFLTLFPDARFRKRRAMVLVVVLLQVLQTCADIVRVLLIFSLNFGDVSFFLRPRLEDALAPALGILIQMQTQLFLLSRAHVYAGVAGLKSGVKWAGTISLAALILASAACGMATSIEIKLLGSFARLSGHPQAPLLNIVAPAWLFCSAFIDYTLCFVVTHELLSAGRVAEGRAGHKSQAPLGVLIRLVRVVLRSGLAVAIGQTATAIVWIVEAQLAHGPLASSWVYLPVIVLPKIYTLTYLTILLAPHRHFRASFPNSSTWSTLPLAANGADLPPLSEQRRRLMPPPHPFGPSPVRDGGEDGCERLSAAPHPYSFTPGCRPAPSTPLSAGEVGVHLPPLHFSAHSHAHSYEDEVEARLMRNDSPVSPSSGCAGSFAQLHTVAGGSGGQQFAFRPQPLALAAYALPASPMGSASSHYQHQPHRQPYSSPHSFPPGHLPLSPPNSPPLPLDVRQTSGESFVYAPSSPLSPAFHSGADSALLRPASVRDAGGASVTRACRLLLPHPPLSTVDEGSSGTPRTMDETYTFPPSTPVAKSGRQSWVMLAGPGLASSEGSTEHLAETARRRRPALTKQHPSSAALAPPSPPVMAGSAASEYTPPKSPRLVERRGAVDLLPASPGRPLRMEPTDDEDRAGWALTPASPPQENGAQSRKVVSVQAPVLRRLEQEIEAALGMQQDGDTGEVVPPFPLPSHFSTPTSSASYSSPASLARQPLPKSGLYHRPKPSLSSSAAGAGAASGSDVTVDAVLRALHAPLPPPPGLPLSSSASSLANVPPAAAPPKKRFGRHRHGRSGSLPSFSLSKSGGKKRGSSSTHVRRSSSGSTGFACKDAKAYEAESARAKTLQAQHDEEDEEELAERSSSDAGIRAW
ncbi:hypothetical protein JCM10213_000751 [Rhodosporidiobolus nylandii]